MKLAAALLFVPSVASAQMTNCMRDAVGGFQCMTTPTYSRPPVDWGAIITRNIAIARQRHVAGMVAKGDCAGAEAYALKVGELGLAQQVKNYCR